MHMYIVTISWVANKSLCANIADVCSNSYLHIIEFINQHATQFVEETKEPAVWQYFLSFYLIRDANILSP